MNKVQQAEAVRPGQQQRALWASTIAFAACFAVWTLFSIIGVRIQDNLGLNEAEFGLLVATPVLTGSLSRMLLGIWSDRYGGRLVLAAVMVLSALAAWLLASVETFPMFLLAALGVGLAGGSFAAGVAYTSRWFESERQGTALGIFGMGTVGAALTTFGAPFLLVAFGWEQTARIYAAGLFIVAVLFLLVTKDDPLTLARRKSGETPRSAWTELSPLRRLQVWRFALYYFFVFGAFVALVLWLPRYLMGVYGVDIETAGMLAAAYAVPASLFRAFGGKLADIYGARMLMYWAFGFSVACTFMLSYPPTDYIIHGIEGPIAFSTRMTLAPFAVLIFVLGFFMSLGMAAVYKHIPVYYPEHVGSVGGLVGMIGGLGGFVLPVAFGVMNELTGVWTSCFMLLFAIAAVSLTWMHFAIRLMERRALHEELEALPQFPEWQDFHTEERARRAAPARRTGGAQARPEERALQGE